MTGRARHDCPGPAAAAPPRSEAPRLDELACAMVLVDGRRVAVLATRPADADGRLCRWIGGRTGARPAGVDAVALLGGGSAAFDLTFQPWRHSFGPAPGLAPTAEPRADLAVACAVVARLTGRILADRVVVASDPRRAVRLRLVAPPRWWAGDWIVARPRHASRRFAARLIFHGELVLR